MDKWIYDDTNNGFHKGGVLHKNTCPTLRAERSGLKVIEVNVVANLFDSGVKGYNRMNGVICGTDGVSQTVRANSGGHNEVKIAEPYIAAMRGRNPDNPTSRQSGLPTQQMLEIKEDGTSNALTTVQKDNLVVEPQVLTPKRTEHGKAVRKAYESGEHQESRHTMTQLEPKDERVSNTLTTVQKDNLILEPFIVQKVGDRGTSNYSEHDYANCIPSNPMSDRQQMVVEPQFRVRKLTPKECWRLMGFTDEDFEKARAALNNTFYNGKDRSSSQLYKMAGNSIVVNVLMAIKKRWFL